MTYKLQFHSNHAKQMFIQEQSISEAEILDQGSAWIIIKIFGTQIQYDNWVYQFESVE